MPTLNCKTCQAPFQCYPSDMGRTKYCSKRCLYASMRKEARTTACWECGVTFSQDRPSRTARFCSKACSSRNTARVRPTTKGFCTTAKGYVMDYVPEHPDATKDGYVMRHRLVMEKKLGRRLLKTEVVHHKNEVKGDNRPNNLELMTKSAHDRLPKPAKRPIACPHCQGLIALSGRARNAKPIFPSQAQSDRA